MTKLSGFMPALLLFAAIAAPKASADSIDPCVPKTTPGGTLVLGDKKPLSDTAVLGSFCGFPGTLTFEVFDIFGKSLMSKTQRATEANKEYAQQGPVPEDPGTYKWKITYTPDKGTASEPVFEKQDVAKTPEPVTSTLMLAGIVFLLVMCKRGVAHRRTPSTF